MILSQSCMYGLRASLLLASNADSAEGKYLPIQKISDELGVSFHFLTKILQVLTHAKILESYKGPNGGVRLARPAKSIHLIDVVKSLDGFETFEVCVLGLPGCGDDNPCPLHQQYGKTRDQLQKMFEKTSLAKLANGIENFDHRI